MSSTIPASSREKVRAHRSRLRAQGLRPVQMWLLDVRTRSFAIQARRQSRLVAASAMAREDQAFINAVTAEFDE